MKKMPERRTIPRINRPVSRMKDTAVDLADNLFDGPVYIEVDAARTALAEWITAPDSIDRSLHIQDIEKQIASIERADARIAAEDLEAGRGPSK